MKNTFKKVATLSMLGTLMACAQLARPPLAMLESPKPKPQGLALKSNAGEALVATTSTAVPGQMRQGLALPPEATSVAGLYTEGRAAHGLGQLSRATVLYKQVLQLEPLHLGALNALGVIQAQDGQTDEAVKLFSKAITVAPNAVHLYNNIGYALLRADRLDEAGIQLQMARQLSPASTSTLQNLALLEQAKRHAGNLPLDTDMQASLANVVQAVAQSGSQLVAVGPQVYALQQATGMTLSETRVATKSSNDLLRGVRLEVANGVGIKDIARHVATRLEASGVYTTRLTNVPPYRQIKTEIQFGPGQAALAKALQNRLPLMASTKANVPLKGGVQLRLVLGHDLAGQAVAAWMGQLNVQTASLPATAIKTGGWMWS